MIKSIHAFFFASVFLISPLVFADNDSSNSGRLPDGRAYRTDMQGNVMVDYIAELELESDSLKRQLQGLESEVEELRISRSCPKEKIVQKETVALKCPEVSCPAQICPTMSCPEKICPQVVCASEEKQVAPQEDCSGYVSKISQLENQLGSFTTKDAAKESAMNAKEVLWQKEVDLLTMRLNAAQNRIADLVKENQINKKQELIRASVDNAKVMASLTKPSNSNATLQDARTKTVMDIKGALLAKIKGLENRARERDGKLKAYQAQGKNTVSLSPQPLKFSNGQSIDELRKEIEKTDSVRNLSLYSKEVDNLAGKINFEIGMMDRLSRMQAPNQ